MDALLKEINKHFSTKVEYFEKFSKVDTRVEGWFKGELIFLFEKLTEWGKIKGYNIEHNVILLSQDGKRIDFQVILSNGEKVLFELKAMVISGTKTSRNLNFYFRDDHVGIVKDFKKMEAIDYKDGRKFLIGFIYPMPHNDKWILAKNKLIGLSTWHSESVIEDSADSHFITLWSNQTT